MPVSEEQLEKLIRWLARQPATHYPDSYWVALYAQNGYVSVWAGQKCRAHSLTHEEAIKECETLIGLIGELE